MSLMILNNLVQNMAMLLLGGYSNPTYTLIKSSGEECDFHMRSGEKDATNASFSIPQPYGSPGRIGGVAGYDKLRGRVVFCGGMGRSNFALTVCGKISFHGLSMQNQ